MGYISLPLVAIVTSNTLVIHCGLHKMQISTIRQRCENGNDGFDKKYQERYKKIQFSSIHRHNWRYIVCLSHVSKNLNKLTCSDISKYMRHTEQFRFWETITHNFAFLNASVNLFYNYVVSRTRFRKEVVGPLLCRSGFQGCSSMRSITSS